jgi:hypothetical protein
MSSLGLLGNSHSIHLATGEVTVRATLAMDGFEATGLLGAMADQVRDNLRDEVPLSQLVAVGLHEDT